MFYRRLPVAAAGLALSILVSTSVSARVAGRGNDGWNLSRYQEAAFRDSLMNAYDAGGVVVLNRHEIELSQSGDGVKAEIEHQWLLFVRDPAAVTAYTSFTFDEYPGRDIDEVEAVRLRGDDRKSIDVKKSELTDCRSYSSHERRTVEFDDLEPGDIIAVREHYALQGDNPIFTHRFDYEYPVLQSDVRIEVPREMMEGKLARGFNWWAGTWPAAIPNQVWERPKSWRFRWGEANIPAQPAGQEPRKVLTTWLFDPRFVRKSSAIGGEIQAEGGVDAAYHGPVVSAQQLSGLAGTDRHHGEREKTKQQPSQASFGRLNWELVASRLMESRFESRIGNTRPLAKLVADIAPDRLSESAAIQKLAEYVAKEIELVDIPVGRSIGDLHDPAEILRRGCATAADKCVLLAALLKTRRIEAAPVLYREGLVIPELASVDGFQQIGLQIQSASGALYANVTTGEVAPQLIAGRWDAVLAFGTAELYRGDDVAELNR